MTWYFNTADKVLLAAEGEAEEALDNAVEGATSEPAAEPKQRGNQTPITVFVIVGTAVVLLIAIVLALRSANKKYGQEW